MAGNKKKHGGEKKLIPLFSLCRPSWHVKQGQICWLWATDVTHLGLKHCIRSSHAIPRHSLGSPAHPPSVTWETVAVLLSGEEDVGIWCVYSVCARRVCVTGDRPPNGRSKAASCWSILEQEAISLTDLDRKRVLVCILFLCVYDVKWSKTVLSLFLFLLFCAEDTEIR